MIIAVTGASGSIGKEVIPFLTSLGFKVITISSSSPADGKSIFSYDDLINNKINLKIYFVIHLASNNSNLDDGKISNELNLTNSILEAMPNLQCKNLIFLARQKYMGTIAKSKIFLMSILLLTQAAHIQRQKSYVKIRSLLNQKIKTIIQLFFDYLLF